MMVKMENIYLVIDERVGRWAADRKQMHDGLDAQYKNKIHGVPKMGKMMHKPSNEIGRRNPLLRGWVKMQQTANLAATMAYLGGSNGLNVSHQ